jgi:hypothetical protein
VLKYTKQQMLEQLHLKKISSVTAKKSIFVYEHFYTEKGLQRQPPSPGLLRVSKFEAKLL